MSYVFTDHKEHFKAARDGSVVTIEVSNNIPVELFDLGRIVLSMEATKPRTVGAKATLIVTLPTGSYNTLQVRWSCYGIVGTQIAIIL